MLIENVSTLLMNFTKIHFKCSLISKAHFLSESSNKLNEHFEKPEHSGINNKKKRIMFWHLTVLVYISCIQPSLRLPKRVAFDIWKM